MSLIKVTYTPHETYINAANLNDIQDSIVALETSTADIATIRSNVESLVARDIQRLSLSTSGASGTFTLESNRGYILVITRANTDLDTSQGLYLVSAFDNDAHTGKSAVRTIADGAASVSVTGLTLSITSTSAYVYAALIPCF